LTCGDIRLEKWGQGACRLLVPTSQGDPKPMFHLLRIIGVI